VVVDHPTVVGAGSPGFSGPSPDLGVNVSVSGHGHVEATGGIRCGYRTGLARSCQAFFREGASVKLRAVPAKRARFLRWESFCQGTRLTCRLQVTATKSVIAVFGRR
jgi:hypothetical protein